MKKLFIILIALTIFLVGLQFAVTNLLTRLKSQSTVHVINMTDDGFQPSEITINKGDTISFKNVGKNPHWPASNNHPTHTIYPGSGIEKCGTAEANGIFDACRGLNAGETFSFTFNAPGVWRFHDHLFPDTGGVITVNGEAVAEATSSAKLAEGPDVSVTKDTGEIFNNDDALRSYIKKFGIKQTILQLHNLEATMGSCHQAAHRTGHISYDLYGDKAFIEYSAYCQSGYYHGVMEQYLEEHGAQNLATNLGSLCSSDLNGFFRHQCIHGIGHGLMAWVNYDLPEALKECDLLPAGKDSCWTGVFMENIAAQPSSARPPGAKTQQVGETDIHYTKYLNADPLYPCDSLDVKYQSSCYFLQTSRMLQLFGQDFQKIAVTCATAGNENNQATCFGSMGRDVGGRFPTDAAKEIEACDFIQNAGYRNDCLSGAVQNAFWDPTGQDFAISFCKLLTNPDEKSACYSTINGRAPEVISDKMDLQAFCGKIESKYQANCKNMAGI